MQSVGIICEYNPLHEGHAYLLARAKERGVVVCVMSGNFTQRGEAAVLPPVPRAAMAVAAGADLVLELPFPYAAASARYFATAGVRSVAAMGCGELMFGSESADAEKILELADRMESEEYRDARARTSAATGNAAAHFAALGDMPLSNDILAMEYALAAKKEAPLLALCPIKRLGADYGEEELVSGFQSATALRRALLKEEDILPHIPEKSRELFTGAVSHYGLACTERLGAAMLATLRRAPLPLDVADAGGGLLSHLATAATKATDYESLCRAAATKRYTDGRIRRVLLYLLAGVTDTDLAAPPTHLRLLAASARGREYLAATRKTREIPVVTKQADIVALGDVVTRQRELAAVSDGLYALCLPGNVRPAELMGVPPFMAE